MEREGIGSNNKRGLVVVNDSSERHHVQGKGKRENEHNWLGLSVDLQTRGTHIARAGKKTANRAWRCTGKVSSTPGTGPDQRSPRRRTFLSGGYSRPPLPALR